MKIFFSYYAGYFDFFNSLCKAVTVLWKHLQYNLQMYLSGGAGLINRILGTNLLHVLLNLLLF